MGSEEQDSPIFVDELKRAAPRLAKSGTHELGSWIVARLNYLTCGALPQEGDCFEHDTDEFGYKVRLENSQNERQASGAIVIHRTRIYFAHVDPVVENFQGLFVSLLADSPSDLEQCSIRVKHPESKKSRNYGWDGYSLLT